MASGPFIMFRANLDDLSIQSLLGASVKIALVKSTYTPDTANNGDALWADVSGDEIASGNGYTSGGSALTNMATGLVTDGHKFTSDGVTWNASGGDIPAWRFAVMYVSGTLWGKTNPLVGMYLGDSNNADIPDTTDGSPLTLNPHADGWFVVKQS